MVQWFISMLCMCCPFLDWQSRNPNARFLDSARNDMLIMIRFYIGGGRGGGTAENNFAISAT